jgi:hypothetical protein
MPVDPRVVTDAVLGRFGEVATVTVGGDDFPLEAAYRAPYAGMAIGPLEVNRPDPEALVRTADWTALGAKPGDVIALVEGSFTVVSAAPNDCGGTLLKLRAFG